MSAVDVLPASASPDPPTPSPPAPQSHSSSSSSAALLSPPPPPSSFVQSPTTTPSYSSLAPQRSEAENVVPTKWVVSTHAHQQQQQQQQLSPQQPKQEPNRSQLHPDDFGRWYQATQQSTNQLDNKNSPPLVPPIKIPRRSLSMSGGERATKQPSRQGPCLVCGDDATGMYFGALVCVPCKTFFLRYAGDKTFICRQQQQCEINTRTRTQCKFCRMQKCVEVGMSRKERPAQVMLSEGQQLCVVCQDIANGLHFGAITCEGCKKFFRRGLKENMSYVCKNPESECLINPRTRNTCRFCRYQKCINAGMSREAIQMGRPSKIRTTSTDSAPVVPSKRRSSSPLRSPQSGGGAYRPSFPPPGSSSSLNDRYVDEQLAHMIRHSSQKAMQPPQHNPVSPGALPLQQPHIMTHDAYNRRGGASNSATSPGGGGGMYNNNYRNNSGSTEEDEQQQQQNRREMTEIKQEPLHGTDYGLLASRLHRQFKQEEHHNQTQNQPQSTNNNFTALQSLYNRDGGAVLPNIRVLNHRPQQQISPPSNFRAGDGGNNSNHGSTAGDATVHRPMPVATPTYVDITNQNHSPTTQPRVSSQQELHVQVVATAGDSGGTFDQYSPYPSPQDQQPQPSPVYHHHQQQQQQQQQQYSSTNDQAYQMMLSSPQQQQEQTQQQEVSLLDDAALILGDMAQQGSDPQPMVLQQPQQAAQPICPPLPSPGANSNSTNSSFSRMQVSIAPPISSPSDLNLAMRNSSGDVLAQCPQEMTLLANSISTEIAANNTNTTTFQQGGRGEMPALMGGGGSDPASSNSSLSGGSGGVSRKLSDFSNISLQRLSEWLEHLEDESKKEADASNSSAEETLQESNWDRERGFEYWQKPELPDENIFFTEQHQNVIDQITTAYNKFVETGYAINKRLIEEFKEWYSPDRVVEKLPDYVQSRLVQLYTLCSVTYCKGLPGFEDFDETDQYNLVRYGQSMSRILSASLHWYDNEKKDFVYFFGYRPHPSRPEYIFRRLCLQYAEMVREKEWDQIEAAIVNSLVIIATDFPNLRKPEVIEESRSNILKSFRAYTTAKYGTPNTRIEDLFSNIPKLRELGFLHHKWLFVTPVKKFTEELENDVTEEFEKQENS